MCVTVIIDVYSQIVQLYRLMIVFVLVCNKLLFTVSTACKMEVGVWSPEPRRVISTSTSVTSLQTQGIRFN